MQGKAIERPLKPGQAARPVAKVAHEAPASDGNHFAKFIAVRDSRNRRVRGLYKRNGRFYAQLWVDQGYGKKSPRRFALSNSDNLPARTLEEAKEAMEVKRHERREDSLPFWAASQSLATTAMHTFRKPECSASGRAPLKMNGKRSRGGDRMLVTYELIRSQRR